MSPNNNLETVPSKGFLDLRWLAHQSEEYVKYEERRRGAKRALGLKDLTRIILGKEIQPGTQGYSPVP